MSLLVDPLTVNTVEMQRRQRLQGAVDAKRRTDTTEEAPRLIAADERALAFCPEPVHARSLVTTSTDILGYWSAGRVPHWSFHRPERRVLLDWAVWCCLLLLAVVLQLTGAS